MDFSLVALRRVLGLREGAAFGLFAAGRTAGWIAHALEQEIEETGCDLETAFRGVLPRLRGIYALVAIRTREPDLLVAARSGPPLVVGFGEGEYFVASDIPAILMHTKEMIFMEDGELVVLRPDGPSFQQLDGTPLEKSPTLVPWDPIMAEKGGYKHFMLKEIHEQPRAVRDTLLGRVSLESSSVLLEEMEIGLESLVDKFGLEKIVDAVVRISGK